MAITKIHPIKSTLNLAISYIVNGEKTDEQILVSTHKCHQETAHAQFLRTRNDVGTNGKSWYENEQSKRGTSWKSRLQFDIDHLIKQSKYWEEFLKKMAELGYEIKYGKHIAFKPKDKTRFTRAKTIGEDYTEERLKERITENQSITTPPVKRRIGNVINMNANAKVKESKGYEYWATKHNLNTMAESVIFIREHGINSINRVITIFAVIILLSSKIKTSGSCKIALAIPSLCFILKE